MANEEFQHILRVLNTNVDGKQKIMFALTSIKGIGRRFANIVCKKADVDMNKRFFLFKSISFSIDVWLFPLFRVDCVWLVAFDLDQLNSTSEWFGKDCACTVEAFVATIWRNMYNNLVVNDIF